MAGVWVELEPAGGGTDGRRRSNRYQRLVKPVLDRLVAGLLLVVLLPLIVGTALVVLVALGRPVLFRQVRVGLGGRPVTILKFRTMRPDRRTSPARFAGTDRRVLHKHPDDPRHVPVGRFLRAWSLDELPQLWNVVRGDMSLVGPRPELPDIVARYEDWQHRRHEAKPGLTGLWQTYARGDGLMCEHTEWDVDYVDRLSFMLDLKILLLTPLAILGARRGE